MKRSVVFSCSISAGGKRAARSAAVTGCFVPGCSDGGGAFGRSVTILYQCVGSCDSERVIFVICECFDRILEEIECIVLAFKLRCSCLQRIQMRI